MERSGAFSSYHPFVNFLYFGLVLGFSMFFMHPAFLLLSLTGGVLYYGRLYGGKQVCSFLRLLLPAALLIAALNVAFNHRGMTILCYLPSGNPLTLESLLYGIGSAALFAAVLLWFGCCTAVLTSDKFLSLFGKVIPALSLLLSLSLRFVPRFRMHFIAVREARAGLCGESDGNRKSGLRDALTDFSATVTWAFENAIETADSMKSRGYGLKGRTSFSVCRFSERDLTAALWLCFGGIYVLCGSAAGALSWHWFPKLQGAPADLLSVSALLVFFAICLTPPFLDGREERKWKSLRSGI